MAKKFNCAFCSDKDCYEGRDCLEKADQVKEIILKDENYKLMKAAAFVEGSFYMEKTRIEEIIEFSNIMGYKHIGIAFCIGLSEEACMIAEILMQHFTVTSVCCKVCGISKDELQLTKIDNDRFEATCNPVAQAKIMNESGVDLNLVVGLCIGHDLVFTKNCKAPVSTLVVKDRVLTHNPLGAVYSGYYRKKLTNIKTGDD